MNSKQPETQLRVATSQARVGAESTGAATHEQIQIFNRKMDPQPLRRKPTLIERIFPTIRFRHDLAMKEDAINSSIARCRAEAEMKIASLEAAQRDLERKLVEKEMEKELIRLKADGKIKEKTVITELPQNAEELAKFFTMKMSIETHDLRLPLTVIMGAAMTLESETLPPSVAKLVNMIINNTQKMKGMIEDTLQCNKLLRGKIELNKKSYDIARQLYGIVEGQTLTARSYKKELSFESSGPIHICGDELKLDRVFENLIFNAIKNSTNRVSVNIETDGKSAIVKVADDGNGIEEERRQKIFELFGTNRNDGNGIGLNNALNLTKKHGGSITLWSEVGKGSTFVVTLPLAQ